MNNPENLIFKFIRKIKSAAIVVKSSLMSQLPYHCRLMIFFVYNEIIQIQHISINTQAILRR